MFIWCAQFLRLRLLISIKILYNLMQKKFVKMKDEFLKLGLGSNYAIFRGIFLYHFYSKHLIKK